MNPIAVYGVTASWRPPGRLRVELPDGRTLLRDGVPEGVSRAVCLLDGSRSPATIAARLAVDASWIDWLVDTLSAMGALSAQRSPVAVQVNGCGDLGLAIARLLLTTACATVLLNDSSSPDDSPSQGWTKAEASHAILCGEGHGDSVMVVPLDGRFPRPGLVVLARNRAEPDRAVTDELVREDQPHLVTSFVGSVATVGPLVVPGRTSCLRCGDLIATDADADWPLRLAARAGRTVSLDPVLFAWTVATVVLQIRAWIAHGEPDALGATIEMDALDGYLRTRRWPSHPRCGCLEQY